MRDYRFHKISEREPAKKATIHHTHICGCGKKAMYLVYRHQESHCAKCMLDAADNSEHIVVKSIN